MTYRMIDSIPVWGVPEDNAVSQIVNCSRRANRAALMADHHLGYAMPIGGVASYDDVVSPSCVGYDIACGNKAVRLDIGAEELKRHIKKIMDDIWRVLSFGVGLKNKERVEHPLFHDDPAWSIPIAAKLRSMAMSQLGTIGSGNHYVDLFIDEGDRVWCGVHFGSRGLGHKLATHFIHEGGGKDGVHVDPVLLDERSSLGESYIACMNLAGRYAYAGRDWVCNKVASLMGANILEAVHNHHNFAWREEHDGRMQWVIRKGATPARPGQKSFIGGTMADNSVIVEGIESDESRLSLYSTVHGAGRVLSRTKAAGKVKWVRNGCGEKKPKRVTPGCISREMMQDRVQRAGVELRGAGTDESPHCYKRLDEVLAYHNCTLHVLHVLRPVGVAMAGSDEFDPYKD